MTIHPEVLPEVTLEYNRLIEKFPLVDNKFLFDRAVWYVRTLAEANTALFYSENINVNR